MPHLMHLYKTTKKIARKMSNDIENQYGKGYNINKLHHEELFMVRQKV